MNIADRIQQLRKMKGISQEELADKLGVSRQAVSKWESEQATPDLDKIIGMSEYFEVTTDYLLKGVEKEQLTEEKKPDLIIFAIVATAFDFLGVIMAAVTWYEEQTPTAIAVGLILIACGCVVYGIGTSVSAKDTKRKADALFWSINIWLLSFIPLSFVYNVVLGRKAAPYPISLGWSTSYAMFWLVYVIACSIAVWLVLHRAKRK